MRAQRPGEGGTGGDGKEMETSGVERKAGRPGRKTLIESPGLGVTFPLEPHLNPPPLPR